MSRQFHASLLTCIAALLSAAPVFADDAVTKAKPTDERSLIGPRAVLEDEAPAAPQVGAIKLAGPLHDGPAPFSWVAESDMGPTLRSIIGQLRYVAGSEHHKGVVFYLDQPALSFSQINEITAAIKETRKAGKKVLFFAEAYDLRGYLLACAGDQIILQQKGFLELTGLGVEEMYLAGLFEKIGIKADFVQTGQFKGADEAYTRKEPSPQWNENFDGLLDDLYGQIITTIAKARKMDKDALEKAMEASLSMDDAAMVKAGLIDRATSRDILDVTRKAFGDDFDWDESMGRAEAGPEIDMNNPFAMFKILLGDEKAPLKRASIALIHVDGVITSGESAPAGMFGGSSVGSNTIIDALKHAKNEPLIKGVVMRIESPGGSALASEVMWQAMRDLAKVKPIWVSIGSLAASGGYYLSVGADKIYVSPQSIVGSIGVVSGKMAMGGLYDWAGISVHRRSRGPLGDMFNSVEPFTPEQKKALVQMSERIYDQFTDRVQSGRGNKVKKIEDVAQGRLFTGQQAVKNGLADKIGGVEIALADLAKELNLEPGQFDIVTLPEPMSLPEFLSSMLGVSIKAPKLSGEQMGVMNAVKSALGPRAWPAVQDAMNGLSLLQRERVLTVMPRVIVVR